MILFLKHHVVFAMYLLVYQIIKSVSLSSSIYSLNVDSETWHHRLGHTPYPVLKSMHLDLPSSHTPHCTICPLSK